MCVCVCVCVLPSLCLSFNDHLSLSLPLSVYLSVCLGVVRLRENSDFECVGKMRDYVGIGHICMSQLPLPALMHAKGQVAA